MTLTTKTVYDLYCVCNKDYLLTMKNIPYIKKACGNTPKSWHDKFYLKLRLSQNLLLF